MKKLTNVSIFLAGIFLVLFVLLFGLNSFNIIFLIGLLYLVLLLLFSTRYSEYSMVLKSAVVIAMLIFNFIYLSFIATLIVNYPEKKKSVNRFETEIAGVERIDGFKKIMYRKKEIQISHKTRSNLEKFSFKSDEVKNLIDNTSKYRQKVINFLNEDKIEKSTVKWEDVEFNIKNAKNLQKIYLLELNYINYLVSVNNIRKAKILYIKLWKGLKTYSGQYNSYLEIINYLKLAQYLVDFSQEVNIKYFTDEKIAGIVEKFIDNLNISIKKSYISRYKSWEKSMDKHNIKEELRKLNYEIFEDEQLRNVFASWPFWDKNRFLSLVNLYFYRYYNFADRKFYEISDSVDKIENKRKGWGSFPHIYSNPIGKIIFSNRVPSFSIYYKRKNIQKSILKAFMWVIGKQDFKNLNNIPIDSLTGRKYIVKKQNNRLIIQSGYEFGDYLNKYSLKFNLQ
ncbi:MAG: hypothetical protein FXF47_05580 [Candidatus Mcinerneyibacterium aminivorans]|uniref:Uncharacterized protein n=1 Tax=Candidatus Mcinerneyibacterium aminivorans TaxID=2703815 RepID=A0A5D0MFH8_9BACT|nr:MAG: hypothetical protein FXF47_05580 [Candidatus Mcinerneyibacterium aminivorans]